MEMAAAAEEQATLRAQAWLYLHDFIDSSPIWSEMSSQITIVRDEVPTMPELNSYGELDEKEGTRACRRLFKAVVVWDELGHNLWKTLRDAAEQRAEARKQFETPEWFASLDGFSDDYAEQGVSRRADRRRRGSEDSWRSVASSHSSSLSKKQSSSSSSSSSAAAAAASSASSLSLSSSCARLTKRLSSASSSRRGSSDTDHEQQQQQARGPGAADVADAAKCHHERSAIPRIISHNCVSVVRRTLGVFADSRTGPRQPR